MKKSIFAFAAAAVLAMPAPGRAQAPETRTTIAVLPFTNGGLKPEYAPLSKGFQALMLNDLATNGRVRVVEREEIQRILDEQKLGASGAVESATIVKTGKLLGAKYMITGTFITTTDDKMQLVIKAFNSETGEIVYNDKTAMVKASNFMDLVTTASSTANAKLNLPQLPAGSPAARDASAKIEQVKKMPLAAAMLYAKAIEAQDSGKPAEARTLYHQMLDKFPDYEPAKTALTKLGTE